MTNSTNLRITATTEFPDGRWDHDANFTESRTVPAGLEIGGDACVNASLTLEAVDDNYSLTVDGDVWLINGYLNVNKGRLYVGEDMNMKYSNQFLSLEY